MSTTSQPPNDCTESEFQSVAQFAHTLLRLVLAVRYRKKLVAAVMIASMLAGGFYYFTATPMFDSKAAMLITYAGRDNLDTSTMNADVQQQNNMLTFENMVKSPKVLEGALSELTPADKSEFGNASTENQIGALRNNISAKAIRLTNILEVNYRSSDPQTAADIVRAVVQSYVNFMDSIHKGTAGEVNRILTRERDDVAEKLNVKQQELVECRCRFADMGFRSDGKSVHPMVQRAVFFNDALIGVQKKRVELEALFATVQTAIANGDDLGQCLLSVGEATGDKSVGFDDRYTQATLEQSLISATAELRTVQQNLGPLHPTVISLAEKVKLTEQCLSILPQERIDHRMSGSRKGQMNEWLVRTLQQKLGELRKKEEVINAQFEATRDAAVNLSGQMAQIEILERDVKRLSDMNDVLLGKIASLDLKKSGPEVRVTVIEEPVVAEGPSTPKLGYTVIIAIIGGICIALGLVTLLDSLDDRFRSVDELQERMGLPLLTMIQRLQPPESSGLQSLVAYSMPTSTASESFRTLRTAISLTHQDARQIVITSTEPGDGKTTTMANLAVCYAQAGKRVLLIDADLRRPGLTNLMDMRGPRGLSEVLRSEGDISQVAPLHVRPSGLGGLDIMPSGPRPTDPAELLSGSRLSLLLAWAETIYDYVFIDSPPTLAATDSAIIGRLIDGVILVVQPAKNRRRMVMRAIERLTLMKTPLLGLVVNRTGSDEDCGYYGYHSYGYSYEYGYGDEYRHDQTARPAASEVQISAGSQADDDMIDADEEEIEELRAMVVPRKVA